jgi:anti-anti-sigma factor
MGDALTLSPPGSGFRIDRRRHRGGYVLQLAGRLDLHAAALLRAEISQVLASSVRPSWLDLDMDRVTSMDRLGLGTLVVARRICAAMGVRLTVNSAPGAVRALRTTKQWDISPRRSSKPTGNGQRHAGLRVIGWVRGAAPPDAASMSPRDR